MKSWTTENNGGMTILKVGILNITFETFYSSKDGTVTYSERPLDQEVPR